MIYKASSQEPNQKSILESLTVFWQGCWVRIQLAGERESALRN